MRSPILFLIVAATLCVFTRAADKPPATGGPWAACDEILGRQGKDLPGGVHKVAWPRADLRVTVDGVPLEPALALTSWAGLLPAERGDGATAMGDLVLKVGEVTPVVRALLGGGFSVTAIHNHLLGEEPRVVYVHFEGKGHPKALAQTLRSALLQTATPAAAPPPPAGPTAEESSELEGVKSSLGLDGALAGRVLQLSAPRAEPIDEEGMVLPPAMGVATAINVQPAGAGQVVATGDFVLSAPEVDWVARALEEHAIAVTALHSHMLLEKPRLFFMHFWAHGSPAEVSAGLSAALSHVAIKGSSRLAPMKP